jgi:hypothetical protein
LITVPVGYSSSCSKTTCSNFRAQFYPEKNVMMPTQNPTPRFRSSTMGVSAEDPNL